MALDFSRVKKAQADAQSKGGGKIDYAKVYFKPALGKQKVRIVPWKEDKTFPFIEVELHKYDTFKKFIPTLSNWEEEDPILKFRKKVYNDVTSTKEDKDFMKNLSPRVATFVQVIVRGQEDQGVRLWELNVTNKEAVMSIAADEDEYGDITDIAEGRDLIVEGSTATNPKTGKSYTEVTVKPSVKKTALSEDPATVKKWLVEQYAPLEQYKRLSAADLKLLLQNFLNPADDAGEDEYEAPAKPAAPKAPAKAPEKKKFVKLEEPEEDAVDPELAEEDETPAPPPAPKAKPKTVKPTPPPVEEEEDLSPEDALEDEIPKAPAKPKAAAKPAAPKAPAKAPVKPLSVASKFDDLYGDDDE